MNTSKLVKFSVLNSVKTLLLIVVMAGIVSLLIYITLGGVFAIAGMFFIIGVYLLTPSFAPGLMLKYYKARKLRYIDVPEYYRLMRFICSRAGLPSLPELYYIPSERPAAFATGDSRHAGIAITAGLMNKLTLDEIAGVVGHEISHIKNNDMRVMWFGLLMNRISDLLSMIGQVMVIINLPLIFLGGFSISWLTIGALIIAPTISYLVYLTLSRVREYLADMGSAVILGTPEPLISALEKIEYGAGNLFKKLSINTRAEKAPELLMTHPPTTDRIQRLKAFRNETAVAINNRKRMHAVKDTIPVRIAKRGAGHNQPTLF